MNSTILFKIGNNAKNGITVLKKPQRREKIGKNKKKEEMDVIDEGKLEKDKKQEEVTRSQDGEPRRSLAALKRAHKILEEADKQKEQELVRLEKTKEEKKQAILEEDKKQEEKVKLKILEPKIFMQKFLEARVFMNELFSYLFFAFRVVFRQVATK